MRVRLRKISRAAGTAAVVRVAGRPELFSVMLVEAVFAEHERVQHYDYGRRSDGRNAHNDTDCLLRIEVVGGRVRGPPYDTETEPITTYTHLIEMLVLVVVPVGSAILSALVC